MKGKEDYSPDIATAIGSSIVDNKLRGSERQEVQAGRQQGMERKEGTGFRFYAKPCANRPSVVRQRPDHLGLFNL